MTFDTFDWENDQGWKSYLNNLLIPVNADSDAILFKFKQKYYKNNVDSDYIIKEFKKSSSSSSSSSSTSNSSSTSQRPSTTSSSSSSNTSSTRQNTNSNSSRPSPAPSASAPPPPPATQSKFTKILYIAWVVAQISTFVFSLAFLILGRPVFYYRAFLAGIIGYSIPLFQTFEGRFNRSQIDVILKNENTHFLGFCLIFYILSGQPSIVNLAPNLIYSFFHIVPIARPYIRIPFVLKYLDLAQTKKQTAIQLAVSTEAMIMLGLIFGLFTGGSSIIIIFVYYKFLKLRYNTNNLSQLIWNEYGNRVEELTRKPWMPSMVSNIILKIKAFVSR
ncbi:transmembrane protein [Cavenderia fasciculata]|uniref:Transmembrane protein n=1 Tax=Cavenderia fasciculata TaxID=261658 RepID=F4QEP6_CACFS|nr:uncharacterized protein DFA_11068 [Cavenderia fasciculata]EGG13307.1 transmembrane protein [Cavenderia fasciculata]|eukprot:XP_004350006.1 transmembrane protein [Cavenderia fasciculata]